MPDPRWNFDDFVTSGGALADLVVPIRNGEGIMVGALTLAAPFSPQNGSST